HAGDELLVQLLLVAQEPLVGGEPGGGRPVAVITAVVLHSAHERLVLLGFMGPVAGRFFSPRPLGERGTTQLRWWRPLMLAASLVTLRETPAEGLSSTTGTPLLLARLTVRASCGT